MNENLKNIIQDFQRKVEIANELLKKHLNTKEPHNWRSSIDQLGILDGRLKYFFHGIGCAVNISETEVVDFDYGSNGRIDGFDYWRLWSFVEERRESYPAVSSEDIKHWLAEALKSGEIERPDSEKYGDLYFFSSNA